MEAITVNQAAQDIQIGFQVAAAIDKIKKSAADGNAETELLFPRNFASAIKSKLCAQLRESGTNFKFRVVRQGSNPYTGRAEYYISERVGDMRRYVIAIK